MFPVLSLYLKVDWSLQVFLTPRGRHINGLQTVTRHTTGTKTGTKDAYDAYLLSLTEFKANKTTFNQTQRHAHAK